MTIFKIKKKPTYVFDGEILNVNDEKGNIDYKKFKLIKHD